MKMLKNRYLIILSFAVFVFSSGCKKNSPGITSLYVPSSADVTANATLLELQQGRTLYINNCNSCHGLYSPDDYSPSQWQSIINQMGPRTGLSASDIKLVTKYVARGN